MMAVSWATASAARAPFGMSECIGEMATHLRAFTRVAASLTKTAERAATKQSAGARTVQSPEAMAIDGNLAGPTKFLSLCF